MDEVVIIVTSLQLMLFGATWLLAFLYSLTVLLVRRFHLRCNVFTVNICLVCMGCAVYFSIFIGLEQFDYERLYVPKSCLALIYFHMVCPLQVSLAFVTFTIYRYYTIVHHTKPFFHSKRWVAICVLSQWAAGFAIPIPYLCKAAQPCDLLLWMLIYAAIMVVAVPSLISLVFNVIIFHYVRSSSRRVQPQFVSARFTAHQPGVFIINGRDLYLLRQMIYMFCIFVGGWGPVYLTLILDRLIDVSPVVIPVLMFLAELAVLVDIIKLFIVNREMRKYLRAKVGACGCLNK